MADAKIRIIGQDKTKGAFKSVQKSFGGLNSSLKIATGALAGFGIALGGAAVIGAFKTVIKAASDAEETVQKFGVVFKSVGDEAEVVAKNLAANFGLSTKAAKALLSATGDLLTGFGFTDKAALDLSKKVQELSVDLASFSNLEGGAERASEILTKALLGERDALVSLGIKIGEQDLKQRALAEGLELTNGRLSKQDTALLTLKIATEQSAKSVGDFSRSQSSFANQSKILEARLDDLAVTLGQVLLPAATKIVTVFIKIINFFNDLVQAPKKAKEQLEAFQQSLDEAARSSKGLNKELKEQSLNFDVDAKIANIATEAINKFKEAQDALAKATRPTIKQLEKQLEAEEEEFKEFEEAGKKKIELRQQEVDALFANEKRITEEEATEKAARDEAFFTSIKERDKAKKKEAEDFKVAETNKKEAAAITVSAVISGFSSLNKALKGSAESSKALAIGEAIINTALGITKAFGQGGVLGFATGAAVAAAGAAQIATISSQSFQTPFGSDRTVPGPSNQAIPALVHGGETIGRGGGSSIMINFNGITGDPSETAQQVITLIRQEESRTGFGV